MPAVDVTATVICHSQNIKSVKLTFKTLKQPDSFEFVYWNLLYAANTVITQSWQGLPRAVCKVSG